MASLSNLVYSILALAIANFSIASVASAGEPTRSPNILIVIADDLGWRDVGFHGSEIKTPSLDKLAAGGVRLDRNYVYPTCSPTRAGILTGRNPSRFDIHGPIADRSDQSLPLKTATLAKTLKQRGYSTALFGKWHLGLRPEVGPRQYGFERTYGYLHGQIDQYTHRYKNGDRSWHRDDSFIDEKGHATDLIADEAIRFLSAKRENPFFLWVAFSVPHHPVQEEEKWIAPYKDAIKDDSRRLFAASVTHMDAAVGRIVENLEKSGQLENTLILFTSDNGGQQDYSSKTEYEGKHGPYPTLGDNKPLRGWKGGLYEGGIRVPAFVRWSGKLKPRRLEQTVSYLDWFPTLARIAGAEIDADWKLEGRDVGPLLRGEILGLKSKPLYWNTGNRTGILDGDWKLIASKTKGTQAFELFNLKDDPEEKKNLSAEKPEMIAELKKLLERQ